MRMNRNRCLMFGALAAVFAVLTVLVWSLCPSSAGEEVVDDAVPDFSKYDHLLRDGDVVCRAGNGIWSDLFRISSKRDNRFSHAGILISDGQGSWNVVHSEADDFSGAGGVFEQPLADFLRNGDAAVVFRLKNEHAMLADELTAQAAIRQYLALPFDLKFDLTTAEELYCTEMVYRFFADLTPAVMLKTGEFQGKEYVPVDSCFDPELFDEILTLK